MEDGWSRKEIDWSIKDIGAPLLDSITVSLYSKFEVFREYVQNSADSYVDFQGMTGRSPMNTIQVMVDSGSKSLTVYDQGVGMDAQDIDIAKAIAVSPKRARATEFAGFRGLGIWSGLSACKQLIIRTSKVESPFEYRLVMNCQDIVVNLDNSIPIDELLRDRLVLDERPADADDHFTSVKLVGITANYSELLDNAKLTRYAEQYLPVPFDPDWAFTNEVTEMLSGIPMAVNFGLTINGEPVYRRFPVAGEEIKKPEKVEIYDNKHQRVGVAWVAETNRRGGTKLLSVGKSLPQVRNFGVRVKNFTIGPRGLYSDGLSSSDKQWLDWFVGEIYVTDPDIKPDTKRAQFQPSPRHDAVIGAIRTFYQTTAVRARGWSDQVQAEDAANEVISRVEAVQQLLDAGFDNEDAARSEVANLLDDEYKENLNAVKQKLKDSEPVANESDRLRIQRDYLRKPEVRDRLTRAIGLDKTVQARIANLGLQPPLVTSTNHAPQPKTRSSKKSSAQAAKLKGTPISPEDAIGAVSLSGALAPAAGQVKDQTVSLLRVQAAFEATLAAILGKNSEGYRESIERFAEELRRRGIDV